MYLSSITSFALSLSLVYAGAYNGSPGTHTGTITTYYGPKYNSDYTPDDGGNEVHCEGVKPDWRNDPYMAAIPISDFGNGEFCNRKVSVCNAKDKAKCITVRIVDSCSGDACKSFDLSSVAADELGGDGIEVTYSTVGEYSGSEESNESGREDSTENYKSSGVSSDTGKSHSASSSDASKSTSSSDASKSTNSSDNSNVKLEESNESSAGEKRSKSKSHKGKRKSKKGKKLRRKECK
ncbi:hypothetical protein ROZALSC1DRAFT_25161 [Rozella allomycis CSF55]|uniref:RlpA-like protein double-psi beta-barrel domain-containing protein n=1 Tax=Rozella allomycis (strain CSF55) TaxID=988480 RepID=A0A4P9YC21_ROZAC|nr:hypothetical protein ROZALSC1DRAFT_25161 [Rozella allomycis CSF55]